MGLVNCAVEIVLRRKIFEILANFLRRGVDGRKIRFGLERESVVVSWDIAGTARVAVLKPSTANAGVFLVYLFPLTLVPTIAFVTH